MPDEELEETVSRNAEELADLLASEEDNDTQWVETDDDEDIFGSDTITEWIDLGATDDEGNPKRMKLVLRDPKNPAVAGAFMMSQESPEAFGDICKMVIVEPKKLVQEKPLRDAEGRYLDESGEVVDSVADAKKVPAILTARSAVQSAVRIKVMKCVGVTGSFLFDYMGLFQTPKASPQTKSSTQSPRSMGSGPPNASKEKQEQKDSHARSSKNHSSSRTSTSAGGTQGSSKTSVKPSQSQRKQTSSSLQTSATSSARS